MADSDLELCNDALAALGVDILPSWQTPGPPGVNVERIYRAQLKHLLGTYPWHFTKDLFVPLTRTTTKPSIRWAYLFRLPHNRLGPPNAYYDSTDRGRPFNRFELTKDGLLTDAEALWCSVQTVPPVQFWPAYFVELVRLASMAEFALAVREDQPLRTKLRRELYGSDQYFGQGGLWALATAADARAAPNDGMSEAGDPVLDNRASGAGFYYDNGEW